MEINPADENFFFHLLLMYDQSRLGIPWGLGKKLNKLNFEK